jgi:hypothetical protein
MRAKEARRPDPSHDAGRVLTRQAADALFRQAFP